MKKRIVLAAEAILNRVLKARGTSSAEEGPIRSASRIEQLWVVGPFHSTDLGHPMRCHLVAASPSGPFNECKFFSGELPSAGIHRIRARVEIVPEQDVGHEIIPETETYQVLEILESRENEGPGVHLVPGESARGETVHAGHPIEIDIDEVKAVTIGGRTYRIGEPTAALIALLPECQREVNRGATIYTCPGAQVVHAGPVDGHNLTITISRSPS